MRLAHTGPDGAWTLIDDATPRLKEIAGQFSFWAPRLACGEAVWALPLTGRAGDINRVAGDHLRQALGRAFPPSCATAESSGLAAVVGTSLVGRANPFQSVAGLVQADFRGETPRFGPILVTRDELVSVLPDKASSAAARLLDLDRRYSLRVGDVVGLDECSVTPRLKARFALAEPGTSTRRAAVFTPAY